MIRLFVGLALPEANCLRLASLGGGVPGARWIAPENMHVTLKFLGDVENGAAEDIDSALATVACHPVQLRLKGVGFFGQPRNARILWAGVEESETLIRLYAKIEAALEAIGIARETRNFAPHVTLARLKKSPAGRLESFVAEHGLFSDGPVEISSFALFSSYLASSGAIYTPEAIYPLEHT
ncbi:MAG TPA: RNA 2',3'-cyclic phosphodiesterase [Rhodospirillaceae bacterium]|nr:RNA 2',3'-cyclic phosphodiesterase [Rhodospirillaceae bacterium]HAA93264.1 RNA 2',3'-cyclic phosphodiesterase [Rhodospirillaceae bacterium]HAT36603.1 RNA 2',3'-cyclic phosphodiesterase [Rhodospirillaceae bacterium]|tara:strand:+ start:15 stop:557 length:543 start_codon:yes stop_codon:yes gene_type:complete